MFLDWIAEVKAFVIYQVIILEDLVTANHK